MRRDKSREDTVGSKGEAKYFLREIWTDGINLNPFDKFDFWRTRFRAHFAASGDVREATSNGFDPTGKSVCWSAPLSPSVIPGQRAAMSPESTTTEGCFWQARQRACDRTLAGGYGFRARALRVPE
jgi:hypothetical protein